MTPARWGQAWSVARLTMLRLGLMSHLARPGRPAPWWARAWAFLLGWLMLPVGLSADTIVLSPGLGRMICGGLAPNHARSVVKMRLLQAFAVGLSVLTVVAAALVVLLAGQWVPLLGGWGNPASWMVIATTLGVCMVLLELEGFMVTAARSFPADLAGYRALRQAGWDGPVRVVAGVASTGGGLLGEWLTLAQHRAAEQGFALRLTARNPAIAALYAEHGFVAVEGNPRAMIYQPHYDSPPSGVSPARPDRLVLSGGLRGAAGEGQVCQ